MRMDKTLLNFALHVCGKVLRCLRLNGVERPIQAAGGFLNEVGRAPLYLEVNLREVFADDADTQQLDTCQEEHGHHGRCPARHGRLGEQANPKRPQRHHEASDGNRYT